MYTDVRAFRWLIIMTGPTEGDWLFGNEPFVSDHVIVYAKYCDGGSWTGENFTETIVNGKQIYYRGTHCQRFSFFGN